MWFIVWTGASIDSDPLDSGCEEFDDLHSAESFADMVENKGGKIKLFYGQAC